MALDALKRLMNHDRSDALKNLMRKLMDRFGKSEEAIELDLRTCDDAVIERLHESLKRSLEGIEAGHQHRNWKRFGEFGLWVMLQDTAYRDVFRWMLDDVLQDADELRDELEPKPPERWYCNLTENVQ